MTVDREKLAQIQRDIDSAYERVTSDMSLFSARLRAQEEYTELKRKYVAVKNAAGPCGAEGCCEPLLPGKTFGQQCRDLGNFISGATESNGETRD